MRKIIFLILGFYGVPLLLTAQTCCSGGVPISNSLGLPFSENKALQINLSYDYNRLNTLIQDKEKLDDNSRTRLTHSILMQMGISLSPKMTLEVLVPYIKQDRSIRIFGKEDFTSTSGLGDISTLISYNILKSSANQSFAAGLGIKAPTGAINNKSNQRIVLNSDLQPGTGAWDVLSLVRFARPFKGNKNINFYTNFIVNFRGTNKDYQPDLAYKFGNEQQLNLGINAQGLAFKRLWNAGVGTRLRNVMANQSNFQQINSSGGRWIFGTANLTHWIIPSKTSINLAGDLPLLTRVSGLQNVPTYRINASFYSLIEYTKKK
jgi:hypothetical protein